ncbi:alpha/beta fold hydrolase [Cellulosimicrobium sp. CUA-896]|uniref:alpha/beta fold hydrolase n=1 Tax=Cellulosimicrobium sp. CUA-896 TaxID=1517881 RepID=UPI0035184672
MWDDVVEALPDDQRVLAVDLPGMGKSPDGPQPPTIEAAADATVAALRRLDVASAVVAGLSMGGYVALAIAERDPDLVRALALVDTKSTADTEEARANRLRIADEAESAQSVDAVLGMPAACWGRRAAPSAPSSRRASSSGSASSAPRASPGRSGRWRRARTARTCWRRSPGRWPSSSARRTA